MNLFLTKASPEDLQIVLAIVNAGTRNKLRRGDFAWGMSDHNPAIISEMISKQQFYLAYDGLNPVGTLALTWDDSHVWGPQQTSAGYVQWYAVAPGYSGQNVGGHILELILEYVAAHGGQYLRIAIPSENMKLRGYYESHGFNRADAKANLSSRPISAVTFYERPTNGLTPDSNEPTPKASLFSGIFHRNS